MNTMRPDEELCVKVRTAVALLSQEIAEKTAPDLDDAGLSPAIAGPQLIAMENIRMASMAFMYFTDMTAEQAYDESLKLLADLAEENRDRVLPDLIETRTQILAVRGLSDDIDKVLRTGTSKDAVDKTRGDNIIDFSQRR